MKNYNELIGRLHTLANLLTNGATVEAAATVIQELQAESETLRYEVDAIPAIKAERDELRAKLARVVNVVGDDTADYKDMVDAITTITDGVMVIKMDDELPPLPSPSKLSVSNADIGSVELTDYYTAARMQAYARDAQAMLRAKLAGQEPVVYWVKEADNFSVVEDSGIPEGAMWKPLYLAAGAAPQAQGEQPILKKALAALELAQDNLRGHGDNCFLHDEGEYASCFCGKDSLQNYLQDVVEELSTNSQASKPPQGEQQ